MGVELKNASKLGSKLEDETDCKNVGQVSPPIYRSSMTLMQKIAIECIGIRKTSAESGCVNELVRKVPVLDDKKCIAMA